MKLRGVDYYLRLAGTALAFILFGVGAVVLEFGLLPWLLIYPGDRATKELRVKFMLHRVLGVYLWVKQQLQLLELDAQGLKDLKLQPGSVIVANHPTLIDALIFIAYLPTIDLITKSEIWNNLFMGLLARAMGYIPNLSPLVMVATSVKRVKAGHSLLIFPEGSRSPAAGLRPFYPGAAAIALRAGAPIVPIAICCEPPTLKKGQHWYSIPERRCKFTFTVLKPIATSELYTELPVAARIRRVNEHLQTIFTEHLKRSAT